MSIINIGLSGLNANRVAMNITALNTANANTVGYTRQQALLGSIQGGNVVGGVETGSGVEVTGIRRVVSSSADSNLRSSLTEAGFSSQMVSALSYIEEVLGADGLNVNETLGEFFASINEANSEPSSAPLRQQILQKAELLAQSISGTQTKLNENLKNQINLYDTQMGVVNGNLAAIGQINEEIARASAAGEDVSGLQDQITVLTNSVAEHMDVNAIYSDDGTVELSTANGQPLVNGSQVASLERDLSGGDPYSTEIALTFGSSTMNVGTDIGGAMGANHAFINDELRPLMVTFDDLAVNIGDEVNAVLNTGFDLNGNAGADLFTYDPLNPGATFTITDISVDELGLSSDGTPGDGGILHDLFALNNKQFTIGGSSNVSFEKGYTLALGEIGASTSKAISINNSAMARMESAQVARDQVSAVNTDEEAANLMIYMNAYNANMRVISMGNEMFNSVLTAF